MRRRQDRDVEAEDRAVGLFDGEAHGHAAAGGRDLRAERAHGEHGRTKARVEHRRDLGSDEGESVQSVHGIGSAFGLGRSALESREPANLTPADRLNDTTGPHEGDGVAGAARATDR